ncbi:MAG: hypothetical protein ABJH45_04045 [Paracoccaceae bacterium]
MTQPFFTTLNSMRVFRTILTVLVAVTFVTATAPTQPSAQSVASVSENRTTFWISAYIPGTHPTTEGVILQTTSGRAVVKAPPAFGFGVAGKCFSTDDRNNSSLQNASARIRHSFAVTTRGRRLSIEDEQKTVGVSHLVDCSTGNTIRTAKSPETDMNLKVDRMPNGTYRIKATASSGNPFFLVAGSNIAPKIDWDVEITYDILARSFSVKYSHGCFPAFEMYAKQDDAPLTTVIFQDDIQNGCTPWALIDAGIGLNSITGGWGPFPVSDIGPKPQISDLP